MSTKARFSEGNQTFFDDKYNAAMPGGVWATCPTNAALHDPGMAHVIFEDFNDIDAATLAGYTVTQASTGTFALTDEVGGVALADCNSGTQHQGVNIQKLGLSIKPAADKDIWYECRFKVVDTATTAQIFVGLADIDGTLLPSGALDANADYVGLTVLTTLAGVSELSACKATAQSQVTGIKTLVEGTYVKFGFKINGVTSIEYWIDDVKGSSTLLTANIPIVDMTPTFVCQADSTTDPILHIDYVKCVQIR
jgi:hypothetical protein